MKQCLLLYVFLLVTASPISAQDTLRKPEGRRIGNGIYLLPTNLVYPEVILSYEHFNAPRVSVLYSAGYKIPKGRGEVFESFGHGAFALYHRQYLFNPFSSGVYVSVAPTLCTANDRKGYFQAEFFYRHLWMNPRRLQFDNVETYSYNSIRSEQVHMAGIKALGGINFAWRLRQKLAFSGKVYGGLSVTYSAYRFSNRDAYDNSYPVPSPRPDYEERGHNWRFPTLQGGLKIGLARVFGPEN